LRVISTFGYNGTIYDTSHNENTLEAMIVDSTKLIISSPDIRQGKPRITGTSVTVYRIAIWYKLGYSAEEIVGQYSHLNLAQVYAALAYYHLHQSIIDPEIAANEEKENRLELEYFKP
jgi:uncharacterized protein (DUF433 family)